MIEFGKTLRTAREAKGYTIGQVAESTRLMSAMIEDLEKEDFSRIAAPIYGRGFVKLYCEAVGLDPKPLVAEFMEIFSGNRSTAIKERPVDTPVLRAPTEPVPEPQPIPEPPPVPAPAPAPRSAPPRVAAASASRRQPPPDSLFDYAANPAAVPPSPPPAPPPAPSPEPPPDEPRLTRYSAPLEPTGPTRKPFRAHALTLPHIPAIIWRFGALVLAALVVIWLLLLGVRALYRATTGSTRPAPVVQQTTETPKPARQTDAPKAKPAAKPAQKSAKPAAAPQPTSRVRRTPQKIPPLYMD